MYTWELAAYGENPGKWGTHDIFARGGVPLHGLFFDPF